MNIVKPLLAGATALALVACGSDSDDAEPESATGDGGAPLEMEETPVMAAENGSENGDGVITCRYTVLGAFPACAEYLEKDGWDTELAATNCENQWGSTGHMMDSEPSCLSDQGADRCKAMDINPDSMTETGFTFYAYGAMESICTGSLNGEFEQNDGSWPEY